MGILWCQASSDVPAGGARMWFLLKHDFHPCPWSQAVLEAASKLSKASQLVGLLRHGLLLSKGGPLGLVRRTAQL